MAGGGGVEVGGCRRGRLGRDAMKVVGAEAGEGLGCVGGRRGKLKEY